MTERKIALVVLVILTLLGGIAYGGGPGKNGAGQKRRGLHPTPVYDIYLEEGTHIIVGDTGISPWWVANILRAEAVQLEVLGSNLTVKLVNTGTPSSTAVSVSCSGEPCIYRYFKATIYLDVRETSGFWVNPEYTISHEYGHAWTNYFHYMVDQDDWTGWLTARGLLGDGRLESAYKWQKTELIADDYRMLFGSPTAVDAVNYINRELPDPRDVPGLREWFESYMN